jgi:hypothetical protein
MGPAATPGAANGPVGAGATSSGVPNWLTAPGLYAHEGLLGGECVGPPGVPTTSLGGAIGRPVAKKS